MVFFQSCEDLGHDVETIKVEHGGIYRHGMDRFAWVAPDDYLVETLETLRQRDVAFAMWLRLIHERDAATSPRVWVR